MGKNTGNNKREKGKETAFHCLVLEDDEKCAEYLGEIIGMEGGSFRICPDLASAWSAVERERFDLMLLDQSLPDGSGSDFFREMCDRGHEAIAIMMTGDLDLPNALDMTRRGLFNYMTKPARMADIQECLRQAARHLRQPWMEPEFPDFVFHSPAMREVRSSVAHAADYPGASVLLTGETGVGKDMVARLIHKLSLKGADGAGEMVALNCANLPPNMFEAELFGVEKGAFTGAMTSRRGLAEAARSGTLFLDEIAELDLAAQAKLLQFLETGEFRRLGCTKTRRFAGRIVAATNRDLHREVEAGRFREDLVYRIDVFRIKIPPLRRRLDDLPALCDSLLGSLATKYGRERPRMQDEDLKALRTHDFLGNVRELRNLLERSLLRTPPDLDWLNLDSSWKREVRAQRERTPEVRAGDNGAAAMDPGRELPLLEAQEYALIRRILGEESGVVRRAAKRLGISSQSLLRRFEKWPELRPQRRDGSAGDDFRAPPS